MFMHLIPQFKLPKEEKEKIIVQFSLVTQSCLILCDPRNRSTPGLPVHHQLLESSPLSQWCHPTILSSVVPFSSCPQSSPASGSFQMSQLFTSVAHLEKNPLAMQETPVGSLGWEDPLEKGKATHSSILAWRIPQTVLSIKSQRIGHDWVTEHASVHAHTHTHTHTPHTHTHRAWPKWVQRTGRWQSWEQQL